MATTLLERLLFAQGQLCFFCRQPLSKADASIEHLRASANGGGNSDENCVACCKAVNRLLGSKPLKDKFQVVLNQHGHFKCPDPTIRGAAVAPTKLQSARALKDENYERVLENLRKRDNARPRTLARLKSSIVSILPKDTSAIVVETLLKRLEVEGVVTVTGTKITYDLR